MCNAFCWIEVVPLAHTKIRFCISAGSSARPLCCVASAAGARVINELTTKMIVATIATELFAEQNQFRANFISLLGLPFPMQSILLRNMNFQIETEKRQAALGGLSAIKLIETDSLRES